jgi:hypothetical protein
VLEGLHDAAALRGLHDEAVAAASRATPSDCTTDDGEEVRGGAPARRFLSAHGGPRLTAVYRTPAARAVLGRLAGMDVEPTGDCGTYSYYVRPGDFLALHRDIATCDLAVITCLSDEQEGRAGASGALCLYPGLFTERLSTLRTQPSRGALAVRLRPGQTIALLGGITPHALLPVQHGQRRVVSVLCYRARTLAGSGLSGWA